MVCYGIFWSGQYELKISRDFICSPLSASFFEPEKAEHISRRRHLFLCIHNGDQDGCHLEF